LLIVLPLNRKFTLLFSKENPDGMFENVSGSLFEWKSLSGRQLPTDTINCIFWVMVIDNDIGNNGETRVVEVNAYMRIRSEHNIDTIERRCKPIIGRF